ncbi:hypothetical protein [Bacillus cereus]|uniref:hypothetical protein n=1 Tax=Bacillus cereus TaxID=1396 RepID=UPI001B8C3327|nr:hypothetical protein [Bacillus cereus]QUW39076.1 hypothetical protein J8Y18_10210 [Bacillus cereus]
MEQYTTDERMNMTGRELLKSGHVIYKREDEKEQEEKHYEGNTQFVFVKEGTDEVDKLLSLEQSGVMMFLLGFAKMGKDGDLYIEEGDKKKAVKLTSSELAKLLGKTPQATNRLLAELEKLSLIDRTKEGKSFAISLGQQFFHIGKLNGEKSFLTKVYKEKLMELAKKVTFSELGLFFKLISHFHYDLHILVDNPHEKSIDELAIWSRKHIADSVGCSQDFAKRAIPKLLKANFLMEITSAKKVIILNPLLVSKQKKSPSLYEIAEAIETAAFSKANFKK